MIQASFNIYPQLLAVQFTDTSVVEEDKTISTWAWDFGDAGNSTAQNPDHTYATPGKYKVSLTVTDSDGSVLQTVRYIMVDSKPILPVTVEDLVKIKLPRNHPYKPAELAAQIATWQMFIQPLVNSPGVADSDVFNESAYPPVVNALIAYLAAYQIMVDYVSSAAISAAGAGVDGADEVVKRIETGPSNAEFRDTSDYLKYLSQPNGLMDQVRKQLCMLAFRSMINVPYCPPLPAPKFIPIKAGRPSTTLLNLWELDPSDVILNY